MSVSDAAAWMKYHLAETYRVSQVERGVRATQVRAQPVHRP